MIRAAKRLHQVLGVLTGMTLLKRSALFTSFFSLLSLLAQHGTALAADYGPRDGGLGLLHPVTPTAERIYEFHNLLLWIITLITIFVLALLIYVMFRFSEKRNPTPSKTTHNTMIEIVWTVVPVLILLGISVPSLKLLYFADRVENADMTIKAIGRQWYWSYVYPDHGDLEFDSLMVGESHADENYLLEVDNALVLPVATNIRVLVTASDVLHNFAVPNFGIKLDAVAGRINETWAYIPEQYAGETFYGQCSELCGTGHAYMPIKIKAVSKEDFAVWIEQAKEEFARADEPADRVRLASSAMDKAE